MIADGHDGFMVRLRLAWLARARGDAAEYEGQLREALQLDPSRIEPLQALATIAHEKHDVEAELVFLRRLAQIDQHDRRAWNSLLRALVDRKLWEEARQVGEGAMFVDVENFETHALYAKALSGTGDWVGAVFELESALLCKPGDQVRADSLPEKRARRRAT